MSTPDNLNERLEEFRKTTFEEDEELNQKDDNIRGFYAAVLEGDDECALEFSKEISNPNDFINTKYVCLELGHTEHTLLHRLLSRLFHGSKSFDHIKVCNILCLLREMGAEDIDKVGLHYTYPPDLKQYAADNPKVLSAMIACALAAGGKTSSNLELKNLFYPELSQAKQIYILGESIEELENDIESMPKSQKAAAKELVKQLRENIPLLISKPEEAKEKYQKLIKEGNTLFKMSNAPWWYAVRQNVLLAFATLGLGYLIAGLVHLFATHRKHFAFFTPAEKIEDAVSKITNKKLAR